MYPYIRLAKVILFAHLGKQQNIEKVGTLNMFVWPSDIDFYPEMNNGRHLTLMDLGRMDLAVRTGLFRLVHSKGWGFLVAGASIRYRHPLKPFRRFQLHTQALGHDERWFYFLQETVQKNKTCSSVLVRGGIRDSDGLIPVDIIIKKMGATEWNPELPKWVNEWINADGYRQMGNTWLKTSKNPKYNEPK